MAFRIGDRESIFPGVEYYFYPKHRINSEYSVWSINLESEYELAQSSVPNPLTTDKYSWNIKKENNKVVVIGCFEGRDEYIGRFDMNRSANEMHGYPIDYIGRCNDKPDNGTLKLLEDNGIITRQEKKAIAKGRKLR